MSRAEITKFPGASQVPTVGQRLCPFMSKAIVKQAGVAAPEVGTIQVACAANACRLWEFCSGRLIERLIDAVVGMGEMFQKGKE